MINLVLGGSGKESLRLEVEGVPVKVLTHNPDPCVTLHLVMEARHAEAPLHIPDPLLPDGVDFRIEHDEWHQRIEFQLLAVDPSPAGAVFEGGHHVDDGQLEGSSDLLGGKTAAILLIHGDDHGFGQFADGVVDFFDPASLAAKRGMTVFHDLEGFHFFRTLHRENGFATAGMFFTPAS